MIERLRGYAEVVAASDGDPYARWTIDPAAATRGAAQDGATLWTVQREPYSLTVWANVVGPPDAVARLLTQVLPDPAAAGLDPAPAGVTVPRGAMELLPDAVRPAEHGDWVWWLTSVPPPQQPGEDAVSALAAGDAAAQEELATLLAEASPTASTLPDDPRVRTWAVVREEGRLVACGADRPYEHGVPHLASIATLPGARGRGLARAVTAWLTRQRLVDDEAAVVTLGMYAGNAPADAVYRRLGFRDAHHFSSGDLHPRPTSR